MNLFAQNEIILMIGVVSVLLICILVLTIFDIRDFLKDKKENIEKTSDAVFGEEFTEAIEPVTPKVVVEEIVDKIPEEVLISDIKDEELADDVFFEEMEDETFEMPVVNANVEMPKVEVQPVVEEEVIPKAKKRLSILDELEEMDSNLPNEKDDITNFEMEQERTAIISLDELMQKSNELYDNNEVLQYDDGNEPITIDEVMARYKKEEENVVMEKEMPEVMKSVVEDENVPFISSVYGVEQKDNALEFENTATYEKLDRQNYNDFVGKLREMNENK